MILSNVAILTAIESGLFSISPLRGKDPTQAPFNTSAIDLHLGKELFVPSSDSPVQLDLTSSSIAQFWNQHSTKHTISKDQPYSLKKGVFILGQTLERVAFPLHSNGETCYSARVEGRSSLARCGILVHFTAPTIHAGFEGHITLEIINLGPISFLLTPEMPICQLIIEEVSGTPSNAPNQFSGQTSAVGLR